MSQQVLGLFDQRVLDGSLQTVYTVAAGHTFVPKTIALTNVSSSVIPTVNLYFVASGDAAANKNIVVSQKAVITTETIFLNTDMYLQAGFAIQVQASVAGVLNCQVSGVDMS
ncbi:MAG: hypothetical protein P4N59_18000 [Negativicutes bacterium]|nr:hypothetical protein [Negativicutes bacterium]